MPKSKNRPKKLWQIVRPPLGPNFELPSRDDLLKVKPGDIVKLIFKVGQDAPERMWVVVEKCEGLDSWEGFLDNDPAQEQTAAVLKYKDRIRFHPLDVINIDSEQGSGTEDTSDQVIDGDLSDAGNSIDRAWYRNPNIIVPAIVALIVGLMSAVATLLGALLTRK